MPVTTEGLFEAKAFSSFEPDAGTYIAKHYKAPDYIPQDGETSERYRFHVEYISGPEQEDGESVEGRKQTITLWVNNADNPERREKDLSTVKGAFDAAGVTVTKKKGGGSTWEPEEFVDKKVSVTCRVWENPSTGKAKKYYSFRSASNPSKKK